MRIPIARRLLSLESQNTSRFPYFGRLSAIRRHLGTYAMAGNDTNKSGDASKGTETSAGSARKLKILMLHGYTQSGALFHNKTRSLEKLLTKSFPASPASPISTTYPGGLSLTYPTGPIRLQPADIPGWEPRGEDIEEPDAWGWWIRETGAGRYVGLEKGLDTIAQAIRDVGGIDGVIGFSQGAAAAGMVSSLLQPGRREVFEKYSKANPEAFPWPASWDDLPALHPEGLKFAVVYSGFYAPNPLYTALYDPKLSAPMCHFIGSLDTVVEESRSLALVDVCVETTVRKVFHPGGHFVPVGKDMGGVLVGFIRSVCEVKKADVGVEDMDVPF